MKTPKILRRLLKKRTQGATLNEKILAFVEQNRLRPLPKRESVLRPEILIPCFNHARFLRNMIEPIVGMGTPITVIDDNSDDANQEIIEETCREFNLKLLRNQLNLRQHGSLNRAIAESQNNLFMVANADDFLLPSWIPYAVNSFDRHDIALIGGLHIDFLNHFPNSEKSLSRMIGSMMFQADGPIELHGPAQAANFTHDNSLDMTMTGCTFLRSAWDFVGGFSPLEKRVSIHDDRDFQMRVCAFFNIGVSSEISAFWRTNTSTGMGTR